MTNNPQTTKGATQLAKALWPQYTLASVKDTHGYRLIEAALKDAFAAGCKWERSCQKKR